MDIRSLLGTRYHTFICFVYIYIYTLFTLFFLMIIFGFIWLICVYMDYSWVYVIYICLYLCFVLFFVLFVYTWVYDWLTCVFRFRLIWIFPWVRLITLIVFWFWFSTILVVGWNKRMNTTSLYLPRYLIKPWFFSPVRRLHWRLSTWGPIWHQRSFVSPPAHPARTCHHWSKSLEERVNHGQPCSDTG